MSDDRQARAELTIILRELGRTLAAELPEDFEYALLLRIQGSGHTVVASSMTLAECKRWVADFLNPAVRTTDHSESDELAS
jgi:hypothetical protein